MTKIVFCHLYNDESGSPRVLRQVIKAAVEGKANVGKLFIGSDGRGVLESCGIPISRYWYYRSGFKVATLFTFLISQVFLFFALVKDRSIEKDAPVYINTLLPFGGALFGKLTGRKVIYHVHEISIEPKPLRLFLCWIARLTSSKNIYVSKAHLLALPIAGVPAVRVYNALDENFVNIALRSVYQHRRNGFFNVLMLASLRDYKGIPELLVLISTLEYRKDIRFDLVVNDGKQAIDRYFSGKIIPTLLTVHPCTDNSAGFYKKACLVLNLSRVDVWIETFGLTILEAMAFGVPVIGPTMGGPAELISDEVEGFVVDSRDTKLLHNKILALADNPGLCNVMSKAARNRSQDFSFPVFAVAIRQVLVGESNIITYD
ncbi:MAG: glycosyltransferase family 4 protein [Methylococcaceae bacterium]|nr:glycosyltransferase family 4 protein [Methylococcaceae bacterium]